MCRKFVFVSDIKKIESRFHVERSYTKVIPVSYCVSGGDMTYVVTMESPHEIQAFQFGMTPYWAKNRMDLINARAEGDKNLNNDPAYQGPQQIFLKKAFLKPIQSQRCLVLADAYYEWSAAKKPYLVYLQDKQRPFAFAGLYDRWKDLETGEVTISFAIITTTANSMLQKIGVKRMPVILPIGYENEWIKDSLSLSRVLRKLNPYNPEKMNAYPVADHVNTTEINDQSMITPVGEKLQSEVQVTRKISSYSQQWRKKHTEPGPPLGERGK